MVDITLTYRVHDAPAALRHPATVQFQGEDIQADVPILEVKLVSDDAPERHGSQVLRFLGADIATATALFSPGSVVEITYRSADPKPEPELKPAPTQEALAKAE